MKGVYLLFEQCFSTAVYGEAAGESLGSEIANREFSDDLRAKDIL